MVFKVDDEGSIFKYKEYIGMSFFIIGILILFSMILSPLNNVFFHPDEFFTFGMIQFPFSDILIATAVDTHPPGHYYILKGVITVLSFFNIGFNQIFVAKMLSILPYALIILVSLTKLRNEYGWFTAGMFVFAIGIMSGFFIAFLTVRMYNWGLFFLLMSFIYFKDILNDSSIKSWVLFSIFSALTLYTHYYMAFSLALIFLSLLVYLFAFRQDTFKEEFKKFIGSIVLIILLYLPWMPKFIEQMTRKRDAHGIPPVDLNGIVNSCIYYLTGNDFLMIKILAIIFTIYLIILAFKKYDFEPNAENYYILSGFFIFFGTIVIAIVISLIKEPILSTRYTILSAPLIWLSISILMGKLKSVNLFIISLTFLLIFGFSGFIDINSQTVQLYDTATEWQNMFDGMNGDSNAIVIHNGGVGILDFGMFLKNIKAYSPPTPTIYGVSNSTTHELYDYEEKSPEELVSMLNNNDTKIYYIDAWGDFDYNDTNSQLIGQIASAKFYYIDR